ncbi:MAG: hypothetical protein V1728_04885 [Candidatus Micrarchaeota archaeon]
MIPNVVKTVFMMLSQSDPQVWNFYKSFFARRAKNLGKRIIAGNARPAYGCS